MVAWEFCYQKTDVGSATFYPGIWRITDINGNGDTDYELVQSNAVTYDPSGGDDQLQCLRFNLSVTEQFTVPEKSVVGLYSNYRALLLRSDTNDTIATYEYDENQTNINNARPSKMDNIHFNIAIRLHLGKCTYKYNLAIVSYCYVASYICCTVIST